MKSDEAAMKRSENKINSNDGGSGKEFGDFVQIENDQNSPLHREEFRSHRNQFNKLDTRRMASA